MFLKKYWDDFESQNGFDLVQCLLFFDIETSPDPEPLLLVKTSCTKFKKFPLFCLILLNK